MTTSRTAQRRPSRDEIREQLAAARARTANIGTDVLHDIADGWRTAGEPRALMVAAKLELQHRHPCFDCGAPAGEPCRPEYGCSPRSRRYGQTPADAVGEDE
jgi:hypothetical protein